MTNENFVAAVEAASIEEKSFVCLTVADTEVVICRFQDNYYALENSCSHALGAFDDGRMRGHRLMCPVHGAMFDIRDGSALSLPAKKPLRSFPVRVVEGMIEIDVSGPDEAQAQDC